MGRQTRWRKILYIRQPFADNFVGVDFLNDLRKNQRLNLYSLTQAVAAGALVVHQLSCVLLFLISFQLLTASGGQCETPVAWTLLLTCAVIAGTGRAICWWFLEPSDGRSRKQRLLSDLLIVFVFVLFGGGLSPLLATLTHSISTDTLYALFTLMMLVHLLTHDYGAPPSAIVSSAVSMNAALFAALCLASRLGQSLCVFSFLTLATLLFALVPAARALLWRCLGSYWVVAGAVLQAAWCVMAVNRNSSADAILISLLFLVVCPLSPLLYVWIQRFKDNINGPWDEAVLRHMDLLPDCSESSTTSGEETPSRPCSKL